MEIFKKKEINKNFKERFRIMILKWQIIGIPIIIYLIILINTDKPFSLRMIPIILITFAIWSIFSYVFKKSKQKEWKLYTPSLDLAYEWKIKNWKANWKWIAYF